LESVYKEQHRYYMMGSVVPRYAGSDFKLGPWTAPKGTTVWVDQLILSRDESVVGRDPDKFLPDRYYGKGIAPKRLLYCGGGTRMCMGWQLMSAATKALYLAMAQSPGSFTFAPGNDKFEAEAVGLIRFPVPSPMLECKTSIT